jgi:SAM-dependent methyltransferase
MGSALAPDALAGGKAVEAEGGLSMSTADGARAFLTSGEDYDRFMGRYARPLARPFADAVGVGTAGTALDAGCGPGALTAELVERLGADAVCAFDPSAPFVADCAKRNPGVDVRAGRCEAIPFEDRRFDFVLAQLVFHFVSDPAMALREMRRVAAEGGTVGACVWDLAAEMQMLRTFWDSALALNPAAPDEARTLRFGREGELAELFAGAGLQRIVETTLDVECSYADFDDLWAGFLAGIGPAGTYCVALPEAERADVRAELYRRLGEPSGSFTLAAKARAVHGQVS